MVLTARTLLIVHGCPKDREIYRRYLLQEPYQIYTLLEAELGQQGLDLLQQHQPDAILLDYWLPDLNGLEFLSRLATSTPLPCLPVVVIVEQGNEAIAVRAIKAGAQDYLVKGQVTPEQLHLAVQRTITAVRMHTELMRLKAKDNQTQIALQSSEERLRLALELNTIGQWEWQIETGVVNWNANHYRLLGYQPGEVEPSYSLWHDRIYPDDIAVVDQKIAQALANQTDYEAEYRLMLENGSMRWLLGKGRGVYDEVGQPVHMVGVIFDVTDRKLKEANAAADLRDTQLLHHLSTRLTTEADIQMLYDEIVATAISLTQADAGTIQILDTATQELVLLAAQGFDSTMTTHFHRVNAASNTPCGIALESGERCLIDFDVPERDDPNGSLRMHVEAGYLSAQSTPLISRSGKQIGMVSTHWHEHHRPSERELRFLDLLGRQVADLIEQRQAEDALRKSEQMLRIALAGAQAGTWNWELATNKLTWSPETYHLHGLDLADGLPDYEGWYNTVLHPDDRTWVNAYFTQMLEQHLPAIQLEFRILHPQLGVRWLLSRGRLTINEQGEPVRLSGINLDISDRKQAEIALQQQSQREQLVANISQEIRQSLDLDEVLTRTVERVREILKTDRVIIFRFHPNWQGDVSAESVGAEWTPILATTIFDPCFEDRYIEPYRQGHVSVMSDIDRADLQPCYVEMLKPLQVRAILAVPILQGNHLWGLLIVHQCSASRQWQTSEIDLLQQLATQVGIAIQQAELYHGLQAELADRKLAENKIREQAALIDISPDAIMVRDLDCHILFWNKGAEKIYGWTAAEILGRNSYELLSQRSLLQVETALQTVLKTGEWHGEFQKVAKSGKELQIGSRWKLLSDETGQPHAILTVETDITEQKQLEAQFLRAQRLESLGTLASGIAHDMNNILAPMLMSAQLLPVLNPTLNEKSQQLLAIFGDNTRRGAELVKQILAFARGMEGERMNVQVKHILVELLRIIKSTFPKSIEIVRNFPTQDLWLVCANATQLHQVFINFCVNARDAMPNGGTLSISAENKIIDETYVRMNLDAKVGSYVAITFEDTGTGIAPEHIDRIFEPFFTTKVIGEGTGLGLSTVLGIVTNHGGFVTLNSKVGQGTQFQVFFPAVEATVSATVETRELSQGQGELILIVDDEVNIREMLKMILEAQNYQVLLAADGIEAIAAYAQNRDIKVVLLDMMMPTMSGATAVQFFRQFNQQVKIIACSGVPTSDSLLEMDEVKAFLTKPFTSDDLLNTLRRVIDEE